MRNHSIRLFFVVLVLFSCGKLEVPVAKKAIPKPEEGQVLRDARAVVADDVSGLEGHGIQVSFSVQGVAMDQYEKDLCTATVQYTAGALTGTIAVSYRWTGEFWKCTGGRDLGMNAGR